MTEAEWLACDDRVALQSFLQHHPQAPRYQRLERRLKLFTCGVCRLVWDTFPSAACRHAVVIAEAYADGRVGANALAKAHAVVSSLPVPVGAGEEVVETPFGTMELPTGPAWEAQMAAHYATSEPGGRYPAGETIGTATDALHGPDCVIRAATSLGTGTETSQAVTAIFRDIFGNPFRPVAFSPEWRTDTAVAIAAQMYISRNFDGMPALSDALQEAGCDSDDIRSHCQGPGPHVRGCWVVDLVLGKE
ncbi:hypothetical protein R5W23_005578 [Gemmata sp. JC673]|uniref:SMI1/KNR4 family protein n=1 Tax=Gemmata algarum TaxID=2975278 RepID=A0ABU5EXN5_9BACT|nr:hypothetical protein [Gemmata algarum]MDY3558461.1 hypothetical protein [Gemmata algarum]